MTTKRQGRPIGARIREVCELLEKHGPINAKNLHALEPQIRASDVTKYARRAVVHGFANIDRTTWPHSYSVKSAWRDSVDLNGTPGRVVERAYVRPAASVWDLGRRSQEAAS